MELYLRKFSNFRFFGIGQPSAKQVAKWQVKKPQKIEKLINKGVLPGSTSTGALVDETYTTPAGNDSARMTEGTNAQTGMPTWAKYTAYGLGGLIVITGIVLLVKKARSN